MKQFKASAIELGFSNRVGVSALKAYLLIQNEGSFQVYSKDNPKSYLTKGTFEKYKKIALNAGISLSDFEVDSVVVQLQSKPIIMKPVSSWEELKDISDKFK